ncbi:MAG: type 1 glutamine amidotransferase [Acidimicrobiia bacterium]
MPTALVLANRDDADPGLVGEALAARGYRLEILVREATDGGWPPAGTADLVLVLGSEWSVYGDAVREPVDRERAFVADAVGAGVPVLGICFGAQMLAAALGGEVRAAAHTELGWMEVEPRPGSDTRADARAGGAGGALPIAPGPWFQFHRDTFTGPPGATLLARSDVGPQAFRLGSALAVQFHPEVTPEIVGRWATTDPGPVARAGLTADELVARTAAEQPRARRAATHLVDTFLATTTAAAP